MPRVGLGFDSHAFVDGRPLRLGGITVPHDRGLAGHSDGDAAAHAVADAVLSAAGLGDLGERYPSSNPRWNAADSAGFLREIGSAVRDAGREIVNVDCVVIAQAPRLASHTGAMGAAMAVALGIDTDRVTVHAKSADHLGFVGREEGIAAMAVALVETGAAPGEPGTTDAET